MDGNPRPLTLEEFRRIGINQFVAPLFSQAKASRFGAIVYNLDDDYVYVASAAPSNAVEMEAIDYAIWLTRRKTCKLVRVEPDALATYLP